MFFRVLVLVKVGIFQLSCLRSSYLFLMGEEGLQVLNFRNDVLPHERKGPGFMS